MPSPFQIAAPALRANGYSVIPILSNSKRPAIEKWSEYGITSADNEIFNRWTAWKDSNVGVCLGTASNLVALDMDENIDGLHEKIKEIIPLSPVIKTGKRGFTGFYQYNGQRSQGFSKNGTRVLDVLSQGRQSVLPPSIHPNGMAYKWLTEKTLENTKASELPHLSLQHIYEIGKLFQIEEVEIKKETDQRFTLVYDDSTLEEAANALSFIPADDYDIWVKMGMALRDKFGDKAFPVWDQWSSTSVKYDSKMMKPKWNSFNSTGLSIASLFYFAFDYGWSFFNDEQPIEDFVLNGKMTGAPKPETVKIEFHEEKKDELAFPGRLLNMPGLPGQIASFINETSLFPQPVLALGASIAACGAIMAHKVRTESDLRTNFYTLGIAPTGAAKEHAPSILGLIFSEMGMSNLIIGKPKSGSAIFTALHDHKGVGLILWDEYGVSLKMQASKHAPTHQREIKSVMMEIFSKSRTVYVCDTYADSRSNPRREIQQPCLSLYGSSTPVHFYAALTGNDVIDGFLPRFLLFESRDYSILPDIKASAIPTVPHHIIDAIKPWKERSTCTVEKGNLADAIRISPEVIPMDEKAGKMFTDFIIDRRIMMDKMNKSGDSNIAALCSRTAEHAGKLALVAHEGNTITSSVMQWAIDLAEFSSQHIISAISDFVSANDLEAEIKRVYRWFKKQSEDKEKWITTGDITRAFQDISARTRAEIIQTLVQQGKLSEERSTMGKSGRPSVRFRAI